VLILLHRGHPRHIVKRHHPQAEIRVIRDAVDGLEESRQRGRGRVVDRRQKICRREPVLVCRAAARARRDVDLAVELADLLAHGVVGAVDHGAAEDDGAVGFEVFGGDGGDFEAELLAVAHDEGVKVGVVVHDVEFRDARDELVVEGEDNVAFVEGLGVVAGRRSAVDFADHEELMPTRIRLCDFLNPLFRDTHNADLGHLNGVCFDIQYAEFGKYAVLDLVNDREEGWGCEA